MPTYIATYTTLYRFDVPKNVVLMTEEEKAKTMGTKGYSLPGHWWVKWGTFYYIDKNGEKKGIQGEICEEHKWPESVEKEEQDDEEEEEDKPICGCCDEALLNEGWGKMVNRGCCSDGKCGHEPPIEALCGECGTWDEEDEVWRCPECQEDIEYDRAEEDEGAEEQTKPDIVFIPSLEVMTVEEQIKMCGETFDQRQTRHLSINQTNICCLGCGEVLWNLRYDADKKILKLISGGLKGYVCGDDSNPACAPEDEEEDEDEDEEDEDEEARRVDLSKKPDACKDCGTAATWIAAFERWSVVDDLCEDCYNSDDDDSKSANSSTYAGGCWRICRFCENECSCWTYNSDHEVVCEDCGVCEEVQRSWHLRS